MPIKKFDPETMTLAEGDFITLTFQPPKDYSFASVPAQVLKVKNKMIEVTYVDKTYGPDALRKNQSVQFVCPDAKAAIAMCTVSLDFQKKAETIMAQAASDLTDQMNKVVAGCMNMAKVKA